MKINYFASAVRFCFSMLGNDVNCPHSAATVRQFRLLFRETGLGYMWMTQGVHDEQHLLKSSNIVIMIDTFCIALFSGVPKLIALYNILQHFLSFTNIIHIIMTTNNV